MVIILILETFIEIPESVNISVGETAEFRSRHTTADVVLWRVNGSLISQAKPPPDITTDFISGSSKLTIVGRLEYSGTEVVGVARFFSASPEESTNPPAILGGIYVQYFIINDYNNYYRFMERKNNFIIV